MVPLRPVFAALEVPELPDFVSDRSLPGANVALPKRSFNPLACFACAVEDEEEDGPWGEEAEDVEEERLDLMACLVVKASLCLSVSWERKLKQESQQRTWAKHIATQHNKSQNITGQDTTGQQSTIGEERKRVGMDCQSNGVEGRMKVAGVRDKCRPYSCF